MKARRHPGRPRSYGRWLLAIVALGSLQPANAAGEIELTQALEAVTDHRYAQAYERYLAAAALGNAQAQLSAGLMASYGERLYGGEIARDEAAADTWLRAAAARGSRVAQFMLGRKALADGGPLVAKRETPAR